MGEREHDSQDEIDERTLRVLERKPIATRVGLLERDALACSHDRDRLSGACDRIATAIEKRAANKPTTVREKALLIGAAAGGVSVVLHEVARLLGK